MKKRDLILILVLTVISFTGLIAVNHSSESGDAFIYVEGSLYGRYRLSQDRMIHISNDNGIDNDIRIRGGCVYMENATCPLKECIKCGKISRDNESICCAPAGILIVIRSGECAEYDAITK